MKQTYKILLLAALSLLLSSILFSTTLFKSFEYKAYDQFSRHLGPDAPVDDIVIIAVDQQSIDNLSKELVYWPWPRQVYAPIIEYLSEAEAVFVDILFTEPSSSGQQDDLIFAEAVRKASNVYLPLFLSADKRDMQKDDLDFLGRIAIRSKARGGSGFESAVLPLDILRSAIKGAGNVTIAPDEDGVYRRVPLLFSLNELTLPNFFMSYLLGRDIVKINDGIPHAGNTLIPLSSGKFTLRYGKNPFLKIPAVDIIRSYLDSSSSKKPYYPSKYFQGKKVFIGLTAAGLYDLKATPISPVSTGVEVHATALENILHKNFIRAVPDVYVLSFALLLCLAMSSIVIKYHAIHVNLAVFAGLLLLAVIVPALLFKKAYYMQIIQPALTLIAGFTLSVVYSYATEGKKRRFIKRTFSQYMDRQLVEYVLNNPDLIKPGGHRQRVTVFFADIAGFTSISEKVAPEDLAKMLHSILNAFTEVIIDNGGVIDKYIGDCVMAFWGAPVSREDDETHACNAAIQCITELHKINEDFRAEGLTEISVRIGIHSGDAIAGNLGSDRLFDYTVVGDTVNTASRLESVNKVFKTNIIISQETIQKTSGIFFTRELALIEVKGKSMPVKIFELISNKEDMSQGREQTMGMFDMGLAAFRGHRWQDALDIFGSILQKVPEDGPTLFYKEKTEYMISHPELTKEFDIIRMEDK